jgi:hypothetical protein
MTRWQPLLLGLTTLGAWSLSSCSPAAFQSATVINSVRLLASRASEPRAKPGDTVTLDLLAWDGRVKGVGTMKTYWLPIGCVNPPGDAYYACFAGLGGGGGDGGAPVAVVPGPSADAGVSADANADSGADAGAGAGAGANADAGANLAGLLRPGMDLTPLLIKSTTARFKMPEDIIIDRNGVSPSYGLVILFNFVCTGTRIELLPQDPNNPNPQQVPIGCFDAQHNQLGAEDFVLGFTRVYAYDAVQEQNPIISQVDLGGPSLENDGGPSPENDGGTTSPWRTPPWTVPFCSGDDDDGGSCPKHSIGPVVPMSAPSGKQVWADFYSTVGTFSSEARLLYDPMATLSIPSGTDNRFQAPGSLAGAPPNPGDAGPEGGAPVFNNFIWIVVHDDQGGANWVTVPLLFQ